MRWLKYSPEAEEVANFLVAGSGSDARDVNGGGLRHCDRDYRTDNNARKR